MLPLASLIVAACVYNHVVGVGVAKILRDYILISTIQTRPAAGLYGDNSPYKLASTPAFILYVNDRCRMESGNETTGI